MVDTFEYGSPDADIVLIQPVDEYELSSIENEVNEIIRLSNKDFRLIAVKIENWNRDLSPWKAKAVFGKEDFGDGAKETLDRILKLCTDKDKQYIIGGYSLAGLFSLWASYQTDTFKAVASASPSMWFPGFIAYMKDNEIKTDAVYLSLGDKEMNTRNPVMATVGDCINGAYEYLKEKGLDVFLEWNKGNHFKDADIRTAKAFSWALERMVEK
ncbi:esterase [Oribacterium sp. FC2011]|uniref:esterase n=1 Tax=Oribacterium sp. FC2011 TaxID=1408311 RepID=UPI0004E28D2B|nr:esterase [Oribacterium sp. FC2011]